MRPPIDRVARFWQARHMATQSGLKAVEALGAVTHRAARILGVEAGTLAPGRAADICIFDPDAAWIVRSDALESQGKNTPFQGLELTGRVVRTLVGGRTVFGRDAK